MGLVDHITHSVLHLHLVVELDALRVHLHSSLLPSRAIPNPGGHDSAGWPRFSGALQPAADRDAQHRSGRDLQRSAVSAKDLSEMMEDASVLFRVC